MTRGRTLALGGIAIVVVALLVAWFLHVFERKTIDIQLPPRGEAVYNPLYALKVALRDDHQRVVSRPHVLDAKQALQPGDTVVLLADPARLSRRESDALLALVARGGHLVVQAPLALLSEEGHVPLLEAFGIGKRELIDEACLPVGPAPADTASAAHAAERDAPPPTDTGVLCDDRFALTGDVEPVVEWGDDAGTAFARFDHGEGTVDVVASLDGARNAALPDGVNAAFVRQLLQPNWGRGTFHLVYASEMPSLWRLLAENGWRALVAFALGIGAWLWMRMQRFGPRLPSPPDERRSLLEHVQATGDHLYRYGRAHLLHAALRTHVIARLRRKDPIGAALEGQAQAERLAAHTGLPAADIASALQTPRPFDARDFRQRIARLIALGRHA